MLSALADKPFASVSAFFNMFPNEGPVPAARVLWEPDETFPGALPSPIGAMTKSYTFLSDEEDSQVTSLATMHLRSSVSPSQTQ